jgi:triacylglycerol lipase
VTDDLVEGVADLAPRLAEEVVLWTARDTHRAVAARVFRLVPGSAPARAVHDALAGAVYGVLGAAARGVRTAGVAAARRSSARGVRAPDLLERSRRWRFARAVVNGVVGDLLEAEGNPLAIPTAVRAPIAGALANVPLDRGSLAAAFPAATGRVAVLLHGLVESDESWDHRAAARGGTYDHVLAAAGVTTVRLRYNTGRRIAANAASLDLLLEDLVAAWPAPVEELLLVGHSMGGLVILGAGEAARVRGAAWPSLVRHVVCLGTPHAGAALEQVANAGAWLLWAVPEARAFGAVLRRRSAGIKDLRRGYLLDGDWAGADPDGWRSPPGADVGPLGDAAHHLVAAALGPTERHPTSRLLGDLLVHHGSATAAGRAWAEAATVLLAAPADHFALLNHPDVAALLSRLAGGQPQPGGGT